MKSTLTTVLLLLVGGTALSQDGWKRPDTVTASVTERMGTGPERSFTVVKKGNRLRLLTSRAVMGSLDGIARIETISSEGIYTWLENKPAVAMQLFLPSSLDAVDALSTPAFSRADLEFHLKGIEKALNRRVLPGKEETRAGRMCLVLNVLDRPDSMNEDYQKLWIDKETGLTMRQEDYFGGALTYVREVTSIELRTKADDSIFGHAKDAVIIRGVASPDTLLNFSNLKDTAGFKKDIEGVNAAAKPATRWATTFDVLTPFAYAQTHYREISVSSLQFQDTGNNSRRSRQNQLTNSRDQIRQILGVQSERATLNAAVIGAEMQIVMDDGTGRREFIISRSGDEVAVSDAPGGQTGRPGSSRGGPGSSRGGATTGTDAPPILSARSDFVDPATGHTVTFVQTRNGNAEGLYSMFVLGTPKPVTSTAISEGKVYSIRSAVPMTLLTWRKGDVRYALSSTSLSETQLLELAAKVK